MEISGAMVVLEFCQVSLFSSRGGSWNASSLEVCTGLFWRVFTWFEDLEGLVVWGVSGTVRVDSSRCCKCVLMALRKSVWFSWICVWFVLVTW